MGGDTGDDAVIPLGDGCQGYGAHHHVARNLTCAGLTSSNGSWGRRRSKLRGFRQWAKGQKRLRIIAPSPEEALGDRGELFRSWGQMKLVSCVGPSMTLPYRTRLRRKQAKLQLPGLLDDIRYGSRLSVASSKSGLRGSKKDGCFNAA